MYVAAATLIDKFFDFVYECLVTNLLFLELSGVEFVVEGCDSFCWGFDVPEAITR